MFEKFAFDAFLKSLENIRHGSFEVISPEGKKYLFEGNMPGPKANMKINSYDVITNLATKGDIGFAEDYRDGKWDSENLPALIYVALKNEDALNSYIYGTSFYRVVAQFVNFFKRNNLKGSKRNIQAHYDLGNDFYSLWLDQTMTYSSAIFSNDNEPLAKAQHNKYDRILGLLGDNSGDILEIGCGWGGFAERAITTKDHRITGITLSNEQHEFANNRLKDLKGNSNIVIEDYRRQEGKFDNIVSIEMFEAVGEKYWSTYFNKIASALNQKGKAVVQTITIADEYFESYRKGGDMIRNFIFPGGMLPSAERFEYEAKKAGLKITDKFHFGKDYARTLDNWLQTFNSKIAEVKALGFDDKFIRIWKLYLASCIASFSVERTDVMQVELQHA